MQKWLHNLLTTAGHLAWKAWIHPQLLKEWREHSVLAKSLLKTSQKKFIRSLRKLFGTLECRLFHSFFGLKSPARVHGGRQTSKGLRGQHVGGSAPSTLSHPKSHRSLRVLYTAGMIETWNSASLPRSALVCQDTDDVLVPSFPLNDLGYTLSCSRTLNFIHSSIWSIWKQHPSSWPWIHFLQKAEKSRCFWPFKPVPAKFQLEKLHERG